MRRLPFILSFALAVCGAPFALTACGVKGPLKLPPPQTGTPAEPPAKTAPAAFPFPPPAAKTTNAEAAPENGAADLSTPDPASDPISNPVSLPPDSDRSDAR